MLYHRDSGGYTFKAGIVNRVKNDHIEGIARHVHGMYTLAYLFTTENTSALSR